MSRKPRSDCVFPYGGQLKRLLTVTHMRNGGLIITAHVRGHHNRNKGKVIQDSKLTVHTSDDDQNGNNTVHGTIQFPDGSKFESHLSSSALRNGRCELITTRSVAHPQFLPSFVPDGKWPVIDFPAYNPELCTMCYQLWYCSPETGQRMRQLHETRPVPYNVWFGYFRRFTLFMPFCYFPVRSVPHETQINQFTTSEEKQTAEQKRRGIGAFVSEGKPPQSVPAVAIWRFNNLLDRNDWLGEYRQEGPPPDEYQFPNFTYCPII